MNCVTSFRKHVGQPCFENMESAANLKEVMNFNDFGLDEQLLKVNFVQKAKLKMNKS